MNDIILDGIASHLTGINQIVDNILTIYKKDKLMDRNIRVVEKIDHLQINIRIPEARIAHFKGLSMQTAWRAPIQEISFSSPSDSRSHWLVIRVKHTPRKCQQCRRPIGGFHPGKCNDCTIEEMTSWTDFE